MSVDEEEYDQLSLFCKKGFSKNWDEIDLRKKDSNGDLDGGEPALSEIMPDLEYDAIDMVNDVPEQEWYTDNHDLPDPEIVEDKPSKVWKDFEFKHSLEVNEILSEVAVHSDIEEIKNVNYPVSEHTPKNRNLLSNESSETKKGETLAHSKELLREKIDDSPHVKHCLNRKDVVVKSILRTMRKYYAELVQDNSEYKRKIRNIRVKHKTLINWAKDLAKALSLSSSDNNVAFYLTALAFPTDLRKILVNAGEENPDNKSEFSVGIQAIDIIENAMTRYSKKVMQDFIRIPEIWLLLLNYLSKVRNEEYQQHYQMLSEMATHSMNKYTEEQVNTLSNAEGSIMDLIS